MLVVEWRRRRLVAPSEIAFSRPPTFEAGARASAASRINEQKSASAMRSGSSQTRLSASQPASQPSCTFAINWRQRRRRGDNLSDALSGGGRILLQPASSSDAVALNSFNDQLNSRKVEFACGACRPSALCRRGAKLLRGCCHWRASFRSIDLAPPADHTIGSRRLDQVGSADGLPGARRRQLVRRATCSGRTSCGPGRPAAAAARARLQLVSSAEIFDYPCVASPPPPPLKTNELTSK